MPPIHRSPSFHPSVHVCLMPLEIKELIIKASVRQDLTPPDARQPLRSEDLAVLKRQILQECRRMIRDAQEEPHRR